MALRRLVRINAGLVLTGTAVAALWIYFTGGRQYLTALARVHIAYLAPLVALTAFCVFARFVRWQFLLRRLGIRVPARPSLAIFLASLVGTATPAYTGELIRGVFMRRQFGIPIRITAWVLVAERLFDVAALGLIGAGTASAWWVVAATAALLGSVMLLGVAWGRFAANLGLPPAGIAELRTPKTIAQALALSLAAWLPAALLVSMAAVSLRAPVSPPAGMQVFSIATLVGGLTLMPAGVGSMGSAAVLALRRLALPAADSLAVVSLVRLASTGASLGVSLVFLVCQLRTDRRRSEGRNQAHFDLVAGQYRDQFSPHIWGHLLDRRIALLASALPPPSVLGLGLDLGCGLGDQCLAMQRRGYRLVGMDAAQSLVRLARGRGVTVAAGSALALPFHDASLAFVYTVGVLHHLPGVAAQEAACREATRVLKPGGLFIVQETNPRNVLFRFYMGYVFPILKSIDEGTEWWIDPQRWTRADGMTLLELHHFTFLPDFIPQGLMRPFLALERRLEASRLRSSSVHYMAILRKQ